MSRALAFAVVGSHPAPRSPSSAAYDGELFDAFDLAVELATGDVVMLGVRTRDYLDQVDDADEGAGWTSGYKPLPVTLDFSTVRHYDFNKILWLGPTPRPCLIWANSQGMTLRAIAHLLSPRPESRLLDGHDGRGLPSPASLGVVIAPGVAWHDVDSMVPVLLRA